MIFVLKMASTKLHDYLSKRFPEWKHLRITEYENITSGWETEIISFNAYYVLRRVKKKEELIARIYPGRPGAYRAKFEFDLLESIHTLGYPVPRVLLIETGTEIFERPFIIMERIIGETMMVHMQEGKEAIYSEMVRIFCDLFIQLHKLDWRKLSIVPDNMRNTDFQSLFNKHLGGQREHVTTNDVEFLVPIIDWLLEYIGEIDPLPLALLHRDFHPMNILLDRKGNPFVIDWTAATISDPRVDVAWSLLLAKLHFGPELHAAILDGYQKVYGVKLENMDYFTIDACLRRLADITISLKKGAAALGMSEDAVKQMKESIGLLSEIHTIVEEITGLRIEEIEDLVKANTM